ncbi:MAG: HAMP domain-containing histidine kinase [Thermosynechococcaceae cyanobacterium MS004]|nr:HAMP domain-containing histidine kinase [Thermosynechococcaceae cyanobacterium MS004]
MAKPRFFGSAKAQILAWLICLVFLAIAGSTLAARQILLLQLANRIDRSLNQEVAEFKRLLAGRDPQTGQPFGDNLAAVFDVFLTRNIPDEDEYFITLLKGKLYASSPDNLSTSLPLSDKTLAQFASVVSSKKGRLTTTTGTLIYLAYPIRKGAGGVFVVAYSLTKRHQDLDRVVLIMTAVMGCAFAWALGMAWIATGKVLAPLEVLTQTARSIKSADQALERWVPVQGSDEIAALAQTFNEMLYRLKTSFTSQRDFINDASHELQTPITVIQGHLELLSPNITPEHQETAWLIQDELQRMSRLVRDLLLLAQSERPDFLNLEMVRVEELTRTIYAKAIAIAPRHWSLAQVAGVRIVADRDRITQAMMNLIKNAVEHTQESDRIEIGSLLADDQVEFWVRNTGTSISPVDQLRIFQRFARGSGSRPRSDGAGLGLSIVQVIVEAHGGHATVKSDPQNGTKFTLILPLEVPQDQSLS